MGAALVAAALAPEWAAKLSSTEQLVLVAMSLTARDVTSSTVERGVWWNGNESLMLALNGVVPEQGTREWDAADRRIRRALTKLAAVGAIKRRQHATARRRAVWEITTHQPQLDPVETDVDNPVDWVGKLIELRPLTGHECPPEPDMNVRLTGHQCPPEPDMNVRPEVRNQRGDKR